MEIAHYHPYRKRVFWIVFLLTFGLAIIASVSLYLFLSRSIFQQAQQDLESIAVKTVSGFPVEAHERLITPEDQNTSGYRQIELYLQSVMAGNPNIDDIYTLRPTDQDHEMVFVVSGKETSDSNHNNYLEENEIKAMLGEKFDTTDLPDLEQGLVAPGHDREITYDKWGAWLSGYAPVKNGEGKAVAVLGVDYSANVLSAKRWELLKIIGWVLLMTLPLCVACGLLLVHLIQRPFRDMADAMQRIKHGEVDYQIPSHKKGAEKLLADYFNSMKNVLWEAAKHSAEKKKQ